MNKDLRWRIISLQVVLIVLFAFGSGLAFYASSFTNDQIKGQLAPQKIFFPKDISTVPEPEKTALTPFVGQQVLNGEQAHVFAESYLGLHLRELADGKVYSELSTEARIEKDPALKAQKDELVQTAFRGESLRSMLNQAWAFGTIGSIASYAGIGLIIATLLVVAALAFELFVAPSKATQMVRTSATPVKA
ncbi:MAG: hypothetical protein ABI670_19885 [Chloroflexota bacterium]